MSNKPRKPKKLGGRTTPRKPQAQGEMGILDPQSMTVITSEGVSPVKSHRVVVGLDQREGVFAHSFKCFECAIEFVVFSWKRDRHGSGVTYCPECGKQTELLHRTHVLTDRRAFDVDAADEISRVWPFGIAPWYFPAVVGAFRLVGYTQLDEGQRASFAINRPEATLIEVEDARGSRWAAFVADVKGWRHYVDTLDAGEEVDPADLRSFGLLGFGPAPAAA